MRKRIISLCMCLVMAFSMVPAAAWAALAPEQDGAVDQTGADSSAYTVAEDSVAVQTSGSGAAAVVRDNATGQTASYTTLYAAMKAAVDGDYTVTLQRDVNTVEEVTAETGNYPLVRYEDGVKGTVVLDLNGWTIDNPEYDGYSHIVQFLDSDNTCAVSLTIQDSKGGGKIQQSASGRTVILLEGTGNSVTIKGGSLNCLSKVSAAYVNSGTLRISGGSLWHGDSRTNATAALLIDGGEVHITGGSITGYTGAVSMTGGELTVSGTTAEITGGSLGGDGLQVSGGTVTLSGGSFRRLNDGSSGIWCADGRDVHSLLAEGYCFETDTGDEAPTKGDNTEGVDDVRVRLTPEKNVTYLDSTGSTATCSNYVEVTEDLTALESGKWYVVRRDVTLTGTVAMGGGAAMILCDGAHLTINGQIQAQYEEDISLTALTLFGQSRGADCGELSVTNTDGAAITAAAGKAMRVHLHGGRLVATGSTSAFGADCGLEQPLENENIRRVDTNAPEKGYVADPTAVASLTVEVCVDHAWEYTPFGDGKHMAYCRDCGYQGDVSDCAFDQYTYNGNGTHRVSCVCGDLQTASEACTPGDAEPVSAQQHAQLCQKCQGQIRADHTMDAAGRCSVCGFAAAAAAAEQDDPDTVSYYGTVQGALDAAAAQYRNGTVTLLTDTGEGVTFSDGSVTVDLNGCTWSAAGSGAAAPVLTVTGGSLTVVDNGQTKGAINQRGSSSAAGHAIRVTGGTLTLGAGVTVVSGRGNLGLIHHYAIDAAGGTVALNGALLNGGLRLSGSAALAAPLTAGAFTNHDKNGPDSALDVSGSDVYDMVLDLLADGCALASCDDSGTAAETPVLVSGGSDTIAENVAIVPHTHDIPTGSTACACGASLVADVNGTYYKDFRTAYDAAGDTYTLRILTDIGTTGETITVPAGRTLTIDLNGCRINSTVQVLGKLCLRDSGDPAGKWGRMEVVELGDSRTGGTLDIQTDNVNVKKLTVVKDGGTQLTYGIFNTIEINTDNNPGLTLSGLTAEDYCYRDRSYGNPKKIGSMTSYSSTWSYWDVVQCSHTSYSNGVCIYCGHVCVHSPNGTYCYFCKAPLMARVSTADDINAEVFGNTRYFIDLPSAFAYANEAVSCLVTMYRGGDGVEFTVTGHWELNMAESSLPDSVITVGSDAVSGYLKLTKRSGDAQVGSITVVNGTLDCVGQGAYSGSLTVNSLTVAAGASASLLEGTYGTVTNEGGAAGLLLGTDRAFFDADDNIVNAYRDAEGSTVRTLTNVHVRVHQHDTNTASGFCVCGYGCDHSAGYDKEGLCKNCRSMCPTTAWRTASAPPATWR